VKKIAKKKLGRPPGRKAPHRPVLAARVPQDIFAAIQAAAQAAGRNMSEQLVWYARQALVNIVSVPPGHHVYKDGRIAPYDPATIPTADLSLMQLLQRLKDEFGYAEVKGCLIPPGMSANVPFDFVKDMLREVIQEAAIAAKQAETKNDD
jgi:hypothetical protein